MRPGDRLRWRERGSRGHITPTDGILRVGFVPLLDCSLLAIAQERGFFDDRGLRVDLRKAQSWSQVRDWLIQGELEAAHMLITIPLQAALQAAPGASPLCYAFTLSRSANRIILGNALWNEGARDPVSLARWLANNPAKSIRLGVVYPRGTQEYFLRSWLARGGVPMGPRITLSTIPPQEMVGRLRKGEIDGFCVGEPWSRRAAASKLGRLVGDAGEMLPGLGDKVLATRTGWHRERACEHARLVRALSDASAWLAEPANREDAAGILASKRYVNTAKAVVTEALLDQALRGILAGSPVVSGQAGDDADLPSHAHAQWYLEQMRRWGHVDSASALRLDLSGICLESFYHEAFQA